MIQLQLPEVGARRRLSQVRASRFELPAGRGLPAGRPAGRPTERSTDIYFAVDIVVGSLSLRARAESTPLDSAPLESARLAGPSSTRAGADSAGKRADYGLLCVRYLLIRDCSLRFKVATSYLGRRNGPALAPAEEICSAGARDLQTLARPLS